MDLSPYRHVERRTIVASPDALYAVIADPSRMGELSPVCTGGEWIEEGRTFRGHNAIGEFTWTTTCRVEVAEPGVEFAWVNMGPDGDVELVRWGYTFTPVDGGTEVAESWEMLPAYPDFVRAGKPDASDDDVRARMDGMGAMARDGMAQTLTKLADATS